MTMDRCPGCKHYGKSLGAEPCISCAERFESLFEEKPVAKYRPYKYCDEMIVDVYKRFYKACVPDYAMPLIWVQHKEDKGKSLITDYFTDMIWLGDLGVELDELFKKYTYLDGSPCGMLE